MTMLVIDTTGDTDTDSVITGSRDTEAWAAATDSEPNVWALAVCKPKAVSACMALLLSAPDGGLSTLQEKQRTERRLYCEVVPAWRILPRGVGSCDDSYKRTIFCLVGRTPTDSRAIKVQHGYGPRD